MTILHTSGIDFDWVASELYDPAQPGVVVLDDVIEEDFRESVAQECRENQGLKSRIPSAFTHKDPDYPKGHQYIRIGMNLINIERRIASMKPLLPRTFELVDAFESDIYVPLSKKTQFQKRLVKRKRPINSVRINTYRPGSYGLDPHLDDHCYRNLVGIPVIAGDGDFGVCLNGNDQERRVYEAKPGSIILLRAPRNKQERSLRPMHYVGEVRERRVSVCIREKF